MAWTLGSCLVIFALLEIWRPCFFLTDDNLSSLLPLFTEMGRHMKHGESPLVTHYLFGGNYDLSRDISIIYWHPFYLLPAMLADTPGRFLILDAIALPFLLLGAAGFVVLSWTLRREYCPELPAGYIVFYALSFTFSTYALMTGTSWINFLGNQSALPWLTLGVLDRKVWRGTGLVMLFTMHQELGAYAQLTLSNAICLTLFAAGMAIVRRSPRPFFNWCAGSMLAVLLLSSFGLHVLDGFAHARRLGGLSFTDRTAYNIPADTAPFAFFMGNWAELVARATGDSRLESLIFPYPTVMLACAASWCLVPALLAPTKWRPIEIVCGLMMLFFAVMVIRPDFITKAMFHIPLVKSMRWPFRESMQFLFFAHLFILLRPRASFAKWQFPIAVASALAFLVPLPFSRPPTFNLLALDRKLVFSGEGEKFWNKIKPLLKPGDQIATVIDLGFWQDNWVDLPYSAVGTANFPAYFQVHCISGYSTTVPRDQDPITIAPYYWFGAFTPKQVKELLAQSPNLRIIRVKSTHPLSITLSDGAGKETDLTSYLDQSFFTAPPPAIPAQSGRSSATKTTP